MFPRIGVATIVIHPIFKFYVLMGKRKGSHGNDTWSFPGGHLEYEETIEACSKRETFEETGLELTFPDKNVLCYTENLFPEHNKHYITIYSLARSLSTVPLLKEPDKCEGWQWFNWEDIVSGKVKPLFSPIEKLLNIFDLRHELKNYFKTDG